MSAEVDSVLAEHENSCNNDARSKNRTDIQGDIIAKYKKSGSARHAAAYS